MADIDEKPRVDPAQADYDRRFRDIKKGEEAGTFKDIADNYDKTADDGQENENIEKASRQEANASPSDIGQWNNFTTPRGRPTKLSFIKRIGKSKLLIGGGAGLGLLGIPILLLFLFFPLKLEMFIQNITSIASSVPSYATEQRLEYLVTRALATRLLVAANGNAIDGKLVFCNKGSVACSLFATYTNDYFEKKLGISIEADANGRTRLGGVASSWNVTVTKGDGSSVDTVQRNITKNSEMKRLIYNEVAKKGNQYSFITRYLTRKLLMKKFGVARWRGPDKLEQSVNRARDAKANIKANIIKATTAKISPRLATYLTCLQDQAACDKLREKLAVGQSSTSVEEPNPDDPKYKDNPEQYDEDKARYESKQASTTAILDGSEVGDDAVEGATKKFITKKILTAVGGGAAAVGVVDLIMSAVGSVDNGALEKIWYDMSTQTYTGFSTEIQIINDKMKLGELDTDTVGAATDLFNDAESSPLYQAESGLLTNETTSTGITTLCNGPDGKKVSTKLEAGQVVCPDQRVVRDYTSGFTNTPGWATIATVAAGWNATVGTVIDFAGDSLGALLNLIPGFKELMSAIGGLVEPVVEWFIGLFFIPPAVGYDEPGTDNYTALSAGIRVENNALFEEGVDEDGTAMGGGGQLLSNSDVATITNIQRQQQIEDFQSQSMIARVFDTSTQFSFISQLAARIPTSATSFARLPMTSLFSIVNGPATLAASSTTSAINPFNLPIYGYRADDPVLSADPGKYTEAFCKASAKAREDSFYAERGSIETYHKSDPCALEKMVVGTALISEGVFDDPYSLKYPVSTETVQSDGKYVLPVDRGYSAPSSIQDFGPRSCAGCSSWHKGIDFSYSGGTIGKPVYAIANGEVVASGKGGPGSTGAPCRGNSSGEPNNTVSIKLDDGVIVNYLHMGGKDITVKVGDKVKAGQKIGKINNCGQSNGAHLHFEIMLSDSDDSAVKDLPKDPTGAFVNPVKYLQLRGVKL